MSTVGEQVLRELAKLKLEQPAVTTDSETTKGKRQHAEAAAEMMKKKTVRYDDVRTYANLMRLFLHQEYNGGGLLSEELLRGCRYRVLTEDEISGLMERTGEFVRVCRLEQEFYSALLEEHEAKGYFEIPAADVDLPPGTYLAERGYQLRPSSRL